MVRQSIYRTAEGREAVLRVHDRAMEALGPELARRTVETRFGRTNLLAMGPEAAPPLVIFQGGNFPAPLTLSWFRPLAERWRVYAPETVGHPGRSAEVRPSPLDQSYGFWAADVLDALELERVPVLGLSYGAGITLRLAEIAPERIERAALLMPAGLVAPAVLPLLARIVPWMLLYRLLPRRTVLRRAAAPMFTGRPEEAWLDALGAVFRHVKLERGMPRSARRDDLRRFHAPVLVLAGEDDPFFPGRAVAERARRVVPGLAHVEVLAGCSHIPDTATLRHIVDRLKAFFNGSPRS